MATRELPPDVAPPSGPPPRERYWWVWLVALLVLVVAGLLIWWLLSRGSDKSSVPDVIGLQSTVAAQRIHDANLKSPPVTGQSNRPPNIVFAQAPGPGTQLGHGQTVTISISSGHITVPNVTSQPVQQAQTTLTNAGFKSHVTRVASSRPKDIVITQSPAAGVSAGRRDDRAAHGVERRKAGRRPAGRRPDPGLRRERADRRRAEADPA